MKKRRFVLLALLVCLFVSGCSGSVTEPDKDDVAKVIASIDAIGTVSERSEGAIRLAEGYMAQLSENEKALVTNRFALVDAREAYDALASSAADAAPEIPADVQCVISAIDAIGEVTSESGDAIVRAERYMALLSEGERALVGNRFSLADAREAYDLCLALDAASADLPEPEVDPDIGRVIAAIDEIGTVGEESLEKIERAERYMALLSDEERALVTNRFVLVDAREEYMNVLDAAEEKRSEAVYTNAKQAYEKLNEAAAVCISGMDDIYNAWHFGIYQASDCTSSNVCSKLANVTSFTTSEIEANGIGFMMVSDWNYCLFAVQGAFGARGTYDQLDGLMADAQAILQELTENYSDYTFYPSLKEYYARLSSYAEFFKSPTGSFSQLADTINDYENAIRTYQTDIGFLF